MVGLIVVNWTDIPQICKMENVDGLILFGLGLLKNIVRQSRALPFLIIKVPDNIARTYLLAKARADCPGPKMTPGSAFVSIVHGAVAGKLAVAGTGKSVMLTHADHNLKTNCFLPFPTADHNKFHNFCLFCTTICMEIQQLTRHFVGYQGVCFSAKIWLSIRKPIGTLHFRGGNGSWHFQLIPR